MEVFAPGKLFLYFEPISLITNIVTLIKIIYVKLNYISTISKILLSH